MFRRISLTCLQLLYGYYNRSTTKWMAYESALLAFTFILFINVFALAILFGVVEKGTLIHADRMKEYLVFLAGVVLVFLVFRKLFPKVDVLQVELTEEQRKAGGLALILYCILSIALLIGVNGFHFFGI